jgi:hypothetical protein
MLVKAKQPGFYGGARRRQGDVFEVAEGVKSKWFDPVEGKAKPKKEAE